MDIYSLNYFCKSKILRNVVSTYFGHNIEKKETNQDVYSNIITSNLLISHQPMGIVIINAAQICAKKITRKPTHQPTKINHKIVFIVLLKVNLSFVSSLCNE